MKMEFHKAGLITALESARKALKAVREVEPITRAAAKLIENQERQIQIEVLCHSVKSEEWMGLISMAILEELESHPWYWFGMDSLVDEVNSRLDFSFPVAWHKECLKELNKSMLIDKAGTFNDEGKITGSGYFISADGMTWMQQGRHLAGGESLVTNAIRRSETLTEIYRVKKLLGEALRLTI